MKRINSSRLWIAAAMMLAVPATLLAQKSDNEKADKKRTEQIIITRTGDAAGKTVIEIEGDKIKVNGKDVKDNKDIRVHRNSWNTVGPNAYRSFSGDGFDFDFNWDERSINLFTEDENRAMLGVTTREHDRGAEIVTITKESGAEKAGLKKGDVLTRIGDRKIENTEDVTKAVKAQKPGDKVAITFLREGKEQKATAELGKWKGIKMNATLPAMPPAPPSPDAFGQFNMYSPGRPKLGLSIQDAEDGKGVKVLEVDPETNAAKAGIKAGDVITEIDGKEIKTTDEVSRIVRTSPSDKTTWNFRVLRGGKTQNIEVRVPRKLKTIDL